MGNCTRFSRGKATVRSSPEIPLSNYSSFVVRSCAALGKPFAYIERGLKFHSRGSSAGGFIFLARATPWSERELGWLERWLAAALPCSLMVITGFSRELQGGARESREQASRPACVPRCLPAGPTCRLRTAGLKTSNLLKQQTMTPEFILRTIVPPRLWSWRRTPHSGGVKMTNPFA